MKTLKEVIGWELMRKFQEEDYDDYIEVLRQIEQMKRGMDNDSDCSVSIPKALLQNIQVPDSYKQYVQLKRKKITLSASLMQKIFSSSVDPMIKHVEKLLQREEACSVSSILLVGGYSSSTVIQHAFREKFEKTHRIIIPLTPDMTVLKGAVITGHRVEAIVGRIAKYHYGLGLSTTRVSGYTISIVEDEKKMFFSLIKKGQTIKVGEVVTQYEIVLKAKSRWANLEIYTSKDDNPKTIIDNEHFTKIGSILVKLPQFKKENILILTISYDVTEFKVVATDRNTGRCFVGTCRFLEKEINQSLS
ncbi:heat shock 70 kDa protein 12B-like [Mytilus edulis]|uniref:heat shock 70 kDa protein 12B-like n=1 Tax=Mytilus edulis TaxID=6550 RepID=UPI0039F084D6